MCRKHCLYFMVSEVQPGVVIKRAHYAICFILSLALCGILFLKILNLNKVKLA